MSDFSKGAVRLASFATSARDFLYPYPTLCPSYASKCREHLLSRTIAFPVGVSVCIVKYHKEISFILYLHS